MSNAGWQGWRRQVGEPVWQKVDGAWGLIKAEAYNRLMELSEQVGHTDDWEYLLLCEDQSPLPSPPTNRYQHRMMTPRS